ncbi:GNAT family N-acetyltransferase [soil metagenome]
MATSLTDQPELVTPRLRLRRLRAADAAVIALHCGNPAVSRMTTSIPHPYPPGLAEAFVERVRRRGETVWALDAGAGGGNGLIGLVALAPRGEAEAEIGYWVAPAFQGAGYASEAVEAVAGHAGSSGAAALRAQVFKDNLASARVLSRAGFAHEGDGAVYSVARGAVVATFRYRLELGR